MKKTVFMLFVLLAVLFLAMTVSAKEETYKVITRGGQTLYFDVKNPMDKTWELRADIPENIDKNELFTRLAAKQEEMTKKIPPTILSLVPFLTKGGGTLHFALDKNKKEVIRNFTPLDNAAKDEYQIKLWSIFTLTAWFALLIGLSGVLSAKEKYWQAAILFSIALALLAVYGYKYVSVLSLQSWAGKNMVLLCFAFFSAVYVVDYSKARIVFAGFCSICSLSAIYTDLYFSYLAALEILIAYFAIYYIMAIAIAAYYKKLESKQMNNI